MMRANCGDCRDAPMLVSTPVLSRWKNRETLIHILPSFQRAPSGRNSDSSSCILRNSLFRVAISKGWALVLSSLRMLPCKVSIATFSDAAKRVLVLCCLLRTLSRHTTNRASAG